MPPLVIGAGIAAAGSVIGGIVQGRSQNRATDASVAATDKALAFQERQGQRGDAAYQERMAIWEANREALLKHLGIDITPPMLGGGPGPGGPGGVPRGAPQGPPGAVPRSVPGAMPRGMTPGMADAKGLQGRSLGELASLGKGRGAWNDWSTMGLRGGGNA